MEGGYGGRRYMGSAGGKLALALALGLGMVALVRAATGAKTGNKGAASRQSGEQQHPSWGPEQEAPGAPGAAEAALSGLANGSVPSDAAQVKGDQNLAHD